MNNISIFNYEAYYLDFLEGNLSEQEHALFLAFMEDHPELRLDDESTFVFTSEQIHLDQSVKNNLKEIAFDQDTITSANVEQFLIAETEGILSKNKLNELANFVKEYKSLVQLQKLYGFTHLSPDLSIVFDEKSALKQTRRIALWPVISFAAAASVAAIFLIGNPSSTTGLSVAKSTKFELNLRLYGKNPITVTQNNSMNQQQTASVINPSTVNSTSVLSNRQLSIKQLNFKALVDLPVDNPQKELEDLPEYPINNSSQASSNYTYNGMSDMKNPIQPITDRLADVVKREVDFRTAKKTAKHPGGFYLKIGKLEISHRKN